MSLSTQPAHCTLSLLSVFPSKSSRLPLNICLVFFIGSLIKAVQHHSHTHMPQNNYSTTLGWQKWTDLFMQKRGIQFHEFIFLFFLFSATSLPSSFLHCINLMSRLFNAAFLQFLSFLCCDPLCLLKMCSISKH